MQLWFDTAAVGLPHADPDADPVATRDQLSWHEPRIRAKFIDARKRAGRNVIYRPTVGGVAMVAEASRRMPVDIGRAEQYFQRC
jgi:hypothetical protein